MSYHFTNLVFEGGGVKGVAYVGALEELDNRGILSNIKRVGGASAGAIVAALVALGYTREEILKILLDMDFKKFMDSSWGVLRDIKRLKNDFGWYKGDFFRKWIGNLIKNKTGSADITFRQVRKMADKEKGFREPYFMVTNLSTGFSEIMCEEKSPDVCIADAVRFSMSIPFFFAARRSMRGDVYVDGGVLDNYPIKLFDRKKYLTTPAGGKATDYYETENKQFLKKHPESSPYIYNKETLGFRLDSEEEIALFRDHAEPAHRKIDDLFDFMTAVVLCFIDGQNNQHLHGDDWQRTIYIDTLGVGATDFSLSRKTKEALLESGRKGVRQYFAWYDDKNTKAANK
ncbi:MAG: patatin-like phospholipase family protein [Betaproteobacteria bacterium]|nr:patatin-like phospholipase family protein [Betaproteobacteria bacterium]